MAALGPRPGGGLEPAMAGAESFSDADVMLRVNPEIAKALKGNNGKALTEMEELTKRTVIVKSDPALHQEQFDIN